jgi:hypothetical protein
MNFITWTSMGGSWKVRVEGCAAAPGDVVQVTARSGMVKTVTLGKIYKSYKAYKVFYLARKPRPEPQSRYDPDAESERRYFGLNDDGDRLDTPFLYGGEPTTNEDL